MKIISEISIILFAVSLIGFHKVWKWGVAWDLSQSPEDYFNLSKNDLKAALKKAPKATRMVRTNKSLVLLKSEHALTNEVYKKIGLQK